MVHPASAASWGCLLTLSLTVLPHQGPRQRQHRRPRRQRPLRHLHPRHLQTAFSQTRRRNAWAKAATAPALGAISRTLTSVFAWIPASIAEPHTNMLFLLGQWQWYRLPLSLAALGFPSPICTYDNSSSWRQQLDACYSLLRLSNHDPWVQSRPMLALRGRSCCFSVVLVLSLSASVQ